MGCVGCLMLHSHELSACLSRFLGLQLIADYRAASTEGACGCFLYRNSQDVSSLALRCQEESKYRVRETTCVGRLSLLCTSTHEAPSHCPLCSIVHISLGSQVLLELCATWANPGDRDLFSLFGCGCCGCAHLCVDIWIQQH